MIGTGGREHALALALSRDPGVDEVHAAPGNPGIAAVATLHHVDPMSGGSVAALAVEIGADLVVVGPEAPLVAGVADAVTAAIVARSTSWSVASFVNYATASFYNTGIQFLLSIIVAIWLLGQSSLAIILCFGPLLLGFELFDRTRGWVDQWIGKLVGLTCFGIGTSILLALQMTGLTHMLREVHDNLPVSGPEAITALLRVGCNVLLDAFTMASLPLICAIGSGVAASLAAPSAMLALRAVPAMMPALRGTAGAAGAAGAGRTAARTPTNSVSRT